MIPGSDPAVRGERLRTGDAELECWVVPWDTRVFGFPVAEVLSIDVGSVGAGPDLMEALEVWCHAHAVTLVSCRIDHHRIRESIALEQRGFRFIETTFEPTIDLSSFAQDPRMPIGIELAGPDDVDAIASIANTAFTTGRFLVDPRLDPALSGARYAEWVRSSSANPSHEVLKGTVNGELIGFFIGERDADRGMYWHLTAVAPEWQGRGYGAALWRAMLLRHRAEGVATVRTTISGHNLAVLNLYARLGFAFQRARMTFHWLRVDGR